MLGARVLPLLPSFSYTLQLGQLGINYPTAALLSLLVPSSPFFSFSILHPSCSGPELAIMEKANGEYVADEAIHTTPEDHTSGLDMKDSRMLEASEVYGNFETAEKYGYVARGYVHSSTNHIGLSC